MKKLLLIPLGVALVFWLSACKKDKNDTHTPQPTVIDTIKYEGLSVYSPVQFKGDIDGMPVYMLADQKIIWAFNGSSLLLGGPQPFIAYQAGVYNFNTNQNILASTGYLRYRKDTLPSQTDFLGLFEKKKYPYTTQGLGIDYEDSLGNEWTTDVGIQPVDSDFEVIDALSTGTDASPKARVLLRFNCTLYNYDDSTQSKKLTHGIIVANFKPEE